MCLIDCTGHMFYVVLICYIKFFVYEIKCQNFDDMVPLGVSEIYLTDHYWTLKLSVVGSLRDMNCYVKNAKMFKINPN